MTQGTRQYWLYLMSGAIYGFAFFGMSGVIPFPRLHYAVLASTLVLMMLASPAALYLEGLGAAIAVISAVSLLACAVVLGRLGFPASVPIAAILAVPALLALSFSGIRLLRSRPRIFQRVCPVPRFRSLLTALPFVGVGTTVLLLWLQ